MTSLVPFGPPASPVESGGLRQSLVYSEERLPARQQAGGYVSRPTVLDRAPRSLRTVLGGAVALLGIVAAGGAAIILIIVVIRVAVLAATAG